MPRSYVLNYVHCVFSTKGRTQLIREPELLWAYMRGIARNCGFDILATGGTNNHVHLLINLPPSKQLVDVMRDLKANSSRFMKEKVPLFAWQDGYAGISVSPSRIQAVKKYISAQENHHLKWTFDDELLALLEKAGVSYDKRNVLVG